MGTKLKQNNITKSWNICSHFTMNKNKVQSVKRTIMSKYSSISAVMNSNLKALVEHQRILYFWF